jgi:hypothetical protein
MSEGSRLPWRGRKSMSTPSIAAAVFGAVLGYLTHYLVRRDANPGIEDLSAIVGVVLGDVVLRTVGVDETSSYLIGLGIGFFLYWAALMAGRETTKSLEPARRLTLFPFLKR